MNDYNIKIIRSKRKTISVSVDKNNSVIVRCPLNLNDAYIDSFVSKHSSFIDSRIAEHNSQKAESELNRLNYGYKIKVIENYYTLCKSDDKVPSISGNCFYIPESFSYDQMRFAVIDFYKSEAKKYITARVKNISDIMNIYPHSVKISSAKTNWGSCSAKNSVNFSWRLLFSSEKAIDSVIVHELSHIKYHNHGKQFWNTVYLYMPDYDIYKTELKLLAKKLCTLPWL